MFNNVNGNRLLNVFQFSPLKFTMADFREQRYAIKYCVILEKSATDTYSNLKKAFEDDVMSERT